MSDRIYTIGHSTQPVESFIELLKIHNITCVVDVRSVPFSGYASQFNQKELKFSLKKSGIQYIHMGKEFGARREDCALYDEDGSLNFEKTVCSPLFHKGMIRIADGIEKGYRIAFMCTEKEPKDCHRCTLVGKAFADEGYDVEHILSDAKIKSQEEIEEELIELYFPNRMQLSFLDMGVEHDYREEAYRKRANGIKIPWNMNADEQFVRNNNY